MLLNDKFTRKSISDNPENQVEMIKFKSGFNMFSIPLAH